ncbi:MAG TPA: alpha-amylase family glycosyl hydrolase [Ktedonobacteraceae bacterium]|nr:alpha-amylase family glycosyl hydrolase [Ktedonobacteraceae bacterium]
MTQDAPQKGKISCTLFPNVITTNCPFRKEDSGLNRLQHPVPWWQSAVIYHLYVRSFNNSNGDGNGDLASVLHRLDYLSETLQVDALWLSPVYPSPMIDAGYDVTDHTGIDSKSRFFGPSICLKGQLFCFLLAIRYSALYVSSYNRNIGSKMMERTR